jgi:hypothetical protein
MTMTLAKQTPPVEVLKPGWRKVPGQMTALYYPPGATWPTWIITTRENFDAAEDDAAQFHGDRLDYCTWREDSQELPAVPAGFEDAWCAEILQEED